MVDDTFSVTDLVDAVAAAIAVCFPDEVWVEGEIADLAPLPVVRGEPAAGRHVFFSLVTPAPTAGDTGGRPAPPARLPVKLFDAQRRGVNHRLRRDGSVKMADGVRIRVRGRVELYGPRSEVQLRMTGIDPAFTVGLLTSERDRVLQRLAADGALEANAAREVPVLPLHVGLVTAAGSAAAADFVEELRTSGLGWRITLHPTRVQGLGAEVEVAAAIAHLSGAGVDVIAVVRGGGARTELAVFDREPVARAIAEAAAPVFTGIGHEVDESVADRVAHSRFKTPTATAAALVHRVRATAERAEATWTAVVAGAERGLDRSDERLQRAIGRLATAGRVHLATEDHRLGTCARRLGQSPARAVALAARRLDDLEAQARAQDPRRVLRRGFSITRTGDGALVRAAGGVRSGTVLHTTLADGMLASRSTGPADDEGVAP